MDVPKELLHRTQSFFMRPSIAERGKRKVQDTGGLNFCILLIDHSLLDAYLTENLREHTFTRLRQREGGVLSRQNADKVKNGGGTPVSKPGHGSQLMRR